MSTTPDEFSERYRKLEDGELLALALGREQLTTSASVALDAELAARRLGEGALREFEDHLRPEVEPEGEDAEDELPPPSELPDDWFDDDAYSSTGSLASSRLKGVTVSAFLFWLSGITTTGWGAWMVVARTSSLLLAMGALAMVLGISLFVVGYGLWRFKCWARKLGEAFCWLNVTVASFSIVGTAVLRLRGFAVDPVNVIWELIGLFWWFLWALYLGRKSTRQAFLAASQHGEGAGTS